MAFVANRLRREWRMPAAFLLVTWTFVVGYDTAVAFDNHDAYKLEGKIIIATASVDRLEFLNCNIHKFDCSKWPRWLYMIRKDREGNPKKDICFVLTKGVLPEKISGYMLLTVDKESTFILHVGKNLDEYNVQLLRCPARTNTD